MEAIPRQRNPQQTFFQHEKDMIGQKQTVTDPGHALRFSHSGRLFSKTSFNRGRYSALGDSGLRLEIFAHLLSNINSISDFLSRLSHVWKLTSDYWLVIYHGDDHISFQSCTVILPRIALN